MVRFRHLHPLAARSKANAGIKRTSSNPVILVELLNLTFERELAASRDSNVKFSSTRALA